MPLTHTRTETICLGLSLFFALVILHNQFAWIVLLGTYYWLWHAHQDYAKPILIIAFLSLTLHHAMAILITHRWMDLPINDVDHSDYHIKATISYYHLPTDTSGYLFFQRLLEWLTWITPSWFLSAEIVIVFFTGALIGFNRLLKQLSVEPLPHVLVLCLFALLPQGLIWQSITLKESLQLCGLVWVLLATLCHYQDHATGKKTVLIIGTAGLLLAMLHEAMTLIMACLIPMIFLALIPISPKAKIASAWGSSLLLCFALLLPIWHDENIISQLRDALIAFHENSKAMIGAYHFPADLKFYPPFPSWWTFIWHTLQISCHYWFGPFPWEWVQDGVWSWKMTLLGCYAWLRIAILVGICTQLHILEKTDRQIIGFALLTYLLITGVFSLGAFNYMQSLRHHGQSDWVLWCLAAMIISRRLQDKSMLQYRSINKGI